MTADLVILRHRDERQLAYEFGGRHVDAVTGATGTSTAVERFLNENIPAFRRAAKAAGLIGDELSPR